MRTRTLIKTSGLSVFALVAFAAQPANAQATFVQFGDDTSAWANDGECDDPRFEGPGAASTLLDEDQMHDASDCRTQFENGQIRLRATAINFGDDSSQWALDSECDDPRFSGPGAASTLLDEDRMRDASDCSALYQAGQIELITTSINFGDDSSTWANDGECDDPRFVGSGMASTLIEADRFRDASDCQGQYAAGNIQLRSLPNNMPNFGDNTSTWANDGECDDPRFVGPGTATTLLEEDRLRDANDCRAQFEAGRIQLR